MSGKTKSSAGGPLRLSMFAILLVALTSFARSAVADVAIRVNAGGSAYTDSAGNLWSADSNYNLGQTATAAVPIAGTSDASLFQSLRWDDASAPELQYSFTVPNGWYQVRLLFAETCSCGAAAGRRIFDVQLEGQTAIDDLDIYAEVGSNAALIKTTTVEVSDGQLNITFLHGPIENPFINAIEILSTSAPNLNAPSTPGGLQAAIASGTQIGLTWLPSTDDIAVTGYRVERCLGTTCTDFAEIAGPATTSYADSGLQPVTTYRYRVRAVDADGNFSPYSGVTLATTPSGTPPVIRVNAGGPGYTDSAGNLWSADTGFNGGNVSVGGGAIAGTTDPTLFQSLRWSSTSSPELEYSLPVANGAYQVKLYFAETFSGAFVIGGRIFSVQLEGQTAIQNLDVYAESGGPNTALVKTATTQVADGTLNVRFVHNVDNPFINAIEVLQGAGFDSQAPAAPGGLSLSSISATRIDLNWNAATDNVAVTGYRVERCRGETCGDFREIATLAGTSFSDASLVASTTYRYRIRAIDAASNLGGYSATANATTRPAIDTQPPSAPTGLTASAQTTARVLLTWAASSDDVGVTGYRVERCEGAGCTNFSQLSAPTSNTYTDTAVLGSRSYRYRVRAVDIAPHLSDYSEIASVDTPAWPDTNPPTAPTGLAAVVASTSQINLTWNVSSDDVAVTGYAVERCTGATCTNFGLVGTSVGTSFNDIGLSPATTYRYRVRARDAIPNYSAYSSVRAATTAAGADNSAPTAPASLASSPDSTSQIGLTWPASTDDVGVTGYLVERCQGAGCTNFGQIGSTSFNRYTDSGLTGGITYRYRVRAMDAANHLSAFSPVATETTVAGNGTAGSATYQYDSFGRLKQITVAPQ